MTACVVIESPFAGDVRRHVLYAQLAMLDCLNRGEAPYASHLLYTQILNDDDPRSRRQGIAAGLAWQARADYVAFYVDLGWSTGMKAALEAAVAAGRPIDERRLPDALIRTLPPRTPVAERGAHVVPTPVA